jgi:DNA polymerase (family 10)
MHNLEIAWAFREMAALLEIKGENGFKANAYRKGAEILENMEPVAEMSQGEMLKVPGLGKTLVANIGELDSSGKLEVLQELRAEIPPGIIQALTLPGVGTKVAHKLMANLKINSLNDLKAAAKAKQIRTIPGLGPKVEVNIQRGIACLEERSGRILLVEAREVVNHLIGFLTKLGVEQVQVAGAVRRGDDMVEQLEIVVDPGELELAEFMGVLSKHPLFGGALVREDIEDQVVLLGQLSSGVKVIFYLVSKDEFIPAWLFHTGNQGHREGLSKLAAARGLSLGPRHFNSQGSSDSEDRNSEQWAITVAEQGGVEQLKSAEHLETNVYSALGLPYIAPELRNNHGEIEAALKGELPKLLQQSDLKGDLHLHSKWSDGVNTIEELVQAARNRGYEYIAITDHSRSLVIARGLSIDRIQEQKQQIRAINKNLTEFRVFSGVETDILTDGRLDYPDELLAELDIVVGSIHSGFRQDGDKLTNRILGAIQNPHVDIVAHPTGRVLGRRDPYRVDIQAILAGAAKYNTALELNSSPDNPVTKIRKVSD